jgi:HSP20 family protein
MFIRQTNDPAPLTRLRGEMDRLFQQFFGDYEPFRAWDPFQLRGFPAVNVWQDDDKVFVEAELPGVNENDLDMTVVGNEFTIKGARRGPEPAKGATMHRRERGTGTFSRIVYLPVEVNGSKVEAEFRNGVLTIALPKIETARPRRIPVKAAAV